MQRNSQPPPAPTLSQQLPMMQIQVQLAPPAAQEAPAQPSADEVKKKSLMRAEAIAHHAAARTHGSPLTFDNTWTSWAYRSLLAAAAFTVLYMCFGTVHEYATGQAVVRTQGRRTVSAEFQGQVETLSVEPGKHVRAGEALVRFRNAEQAEQYRLSSMEFDLQLVRLLRDPTDLAAKSALTSLKIQKDRAKAMMDQRTILSPVDGVVSDIRIHLGQHISPGEAILTVSPENAPVYLDIVVPGDFRPQIHPGSTIRFALDGYKYEYLNLEVESIGEESIGANEVARYLGTEIAGAVKLQQGSQALVKAKLPARTFQSEGESFKFTDGLTGTAEIRVRSEPLVVTLLPAVKSLFVH
jgi:multidrug efflux pump subunit AcrA (membrane-fusion protein)